MNAVGWRVDGHFGFFIYGATFCIGAVFGMAELISRHRDHRWLAARTGPSLGYLALNGGMSIFALLTIGYLKPEWLGFKDGQAPSEFMVVLAAGFGAAAFFRTSFFKLQTSEGEFAVGPALVIDIFLKVIDESVDRIIAQQRLREVSAIMTGVDFDKASQNLPTYCFAALKRLAPDAQQQFAMQLKELVDAPNIDPMVKATSLGWSVMTWTGRPVLEEAVTLLGDKIR